MKKLIVFIGIVSLFFSCSSTDYNGCVKTMKEQGYSSDEAEDICYDGQYESQIR